MTVGMAKDRLPLLRCHPGSSAQPALAIPGPSPAPGTQPFLCSGWVTQSHRRAWEEYSNSSSEAQPGLRAGRSGKRHFYPQFLRSQLGRAIGSGESFSLRPPRLSPAKRS